MAGQNRQAVIKQDMFGYSPCFFPIVQQCVATTEVHSYKKHRLELIASD